jgi:hypothetical protein
MALELVGRDEGGNLVEIKSTSGGSIKVFTGDASTPSSVGAIRFFSENDTGEKVGAAELYSPETDDDFRLRTASDTMLDIENFNYLAQYTGKFLYRNTTMTNTWSASGMTTNATGITTTGTGTVFQSYQYYAMFGSSMLYVEMEGSFSALPTTNRVDDWGVALAASTWPYAATDGVYFRLTAEGIKGVANFSTAEATTAIFDFTYVPNTKYQFIISISTRRVGFWIDNVLYGAINTPAGQGQPFMSASLPFYYRSVISGGAAGAVLSTTLNSYAITASGFTTADNQSTIGNRILGSYQGLSGGTMGSLANYANSANPTAAVPTNTTAALGTGLGGQFWETDTLAVTTDGIICSYQVLAGTVSVHGRRLVLRGVNIQSFVQGVLTGGGYVAQWSLAFGHTTVSLATAEGVASKAPRRVGLGLQAVASGATAGTVLSSIQINFDSPIFVNPGEFVACVKKKVGTAPSGGTIAHLITYDYGWE